MVEIVRAAFGEPEIVNDPFADFWLLYPRHVAKLDARKAWAKISAAKHGEIFSALYDWRRSWLARNEIDFIPYPATWLNGERWEDELPAEFRQRSAHASQAPAQLPEPSPRTSIPAHVLALLAKLREKG